jgi:hypothetical protein
MYTQIKTTLLQSISGNLLSILRSFFVFLNCDCIYDIIVYVYLLPFTWPTAWWQQAMLPPINVTYVTTNKKDYRHHWLILN